MSASHRDNSWRSRALPLAVIGAVLCIGAGFLLGFTLSGSSESGNANTRPNSVDIGFSQDMTVHHLQAVEMSAAVISTTDDDSVRTLAFGILTAQENQVGQMQAWLDVWDQPRRAAGDYMTWMPADEHAGHESPDMGADAAAMPGMATAADMSNLRQARGDDQDTLFLQLMLRHHQGGLSMLEYAIDNADTPVVLNIARSMSEGQNKEIALMERMLADRGAEPLPFG
ncbi:DUF305 domain-containing protein [Hoyosella rhizosphaerae]|uniref:DUF305 domain-containing protein n=1 Tax=Hoyosella rhizosphaerae TaxID=1755582 RepID=A0A916UF73_9ACTN|nr:DUF305 domain-containing protein [Hoyosella rhizosphaerae]MBN4927853.1 DUF305 domain-containing protein [Hoyosella rhizosphaerae]GGC70482.1 DUF305 domain-containing protein [Hoyosella rhizosphaerae]